MPEKIDVHAHYIPNAYRHYLDEHGYFGGQATPAWSPDAALEKMDELGVAASVLSLARPGFPFGDADRVAAMARHVNEYAAGLVRDRPDRFGLFAALPLPDLASALRELEHAYDALSCDGVILLANCAGVYLGDPSLDDLMAELDRREAVVLVHPNTPPGPSLTGVPVFAADFLLDTTRAALNLVRHGVLRRHPRIRFILAHGGGFLPYASHRIAGLTPGEDGSVDRDRFLRECSAFYFDTALTASPYSLPSLLAFAEPGHVLFGSDWPFASLDNSEHFTAELDAYPLPTGTRRSIERGAAESLLPRFASAETG
ncbi:amidohydrolase family protein [Microbacterium immunditiarum]|uniref:Putative TIM-barrel fold metal-dependent hydrolase n=1 Tax=Microbacterium immunditiarum TaxID=337480 RepID=A0A7Y9GKP2_9MICO|nr:amidohydrolase family protein [Microbacterium immunditiarum]NYE18285.1 putative TIM-barrel fold metal-dependent hydrolase [Microbacterium immunditiarum]